MSFISSMRSRYLAWSHSTPLPVFSDTAAPVFQQWHIFDRSTCNWTAVQSGTPTVQAGSTGNPKSTTQTPHLRLLTWNIDAFGDKHESRMEAILSNLRQNFTSGSGPDVIFFQEVSRQALAYLLQHAWVREHWILSEADEANWVGVPFATMTLLSRSRFNAVCNNASSQPGSTSVSTVTDNNLLSLGPVWRVKYPSRFRRDALCFDIFSNGTTRVRLVNVHLDSLPIQPNQRPRQVAIATDLLRTAGVGRGIIAGDWNPVTQEDITLVWKNGLTDAWEALHPSEDGFTWGLHGAGEPFPPGRLDKVATLGLTPVDIMVIHPEKLSPAGKSGENEAGDGKDGIPWSDHSGILCTFICNSDAAS